MAKTAKEIAQWVIDNRYPKSEYEKVSDHEMYHELVVMIENLQREPISLDCTNCKDYETSKYADPCNDCIAHINHRLKNN